MRSACLLMTGSAQGVVVPMTGVANAEDDASPATMAPATSADAAPLPLQHTYAAGDDMAAAAELAAAQSHAAQAAGSSGSRTPRPPKRPKPKRSPFTSTLLPAPPISRACPVTEPPCPRPPLRIAWGKLTSQGTVQRTLGSLRMLRSQVPIIRLVLYRCTFTQCCAPPGSCL